MLMDKTTSESYLSGWNPLFSYRGRYNSWISVAYILQRNLFLS